MAWPNNPRAAKSLLKLRQQLNDKYPSRNKASDGLQGDTAHAARGKASDHNAWLLVDGVGVVTGMDITHDPTTGPNGGLLAQALTADSRTKYVIFSGRIYKARTGQWEAYHGPSPHTHHVHLSVKPDLCDNESTWALDTNIPPESYPVLSRGARGLAVRVLQEKLNLTTDGIFGPATEAKVRLLQRAHGLTDDGVVGESTWSALLVP